jgi:hypothetical protein
MRLLAAIFFFCVAVQMWAQDWCGVLTESWGTPTGISCTIPTSTFNQTQPFTVWWSDPDDNPYAYADVNPFGAGRCSLCRPPGSSRRAGGFSSVLRLLAVS